ncbi:TetR/AcrR family transcriptional regulator [Streptomyces iconiensis]|uniref:TetR/AcrR family transcriptional regulator C-terminal domain-containing protein n=1 Tax=Streptomyces iconiensis TaxID=1384038 RepID=A0ABT6ZR84_9ACTN|nr:TetR/AcrR family transcriptional regulator C-terminal domain-containing protein [Streptomyces iconiensis]MDJ1131560.1 TetR/AcrR family transcriptional regulator C-terminal domain-containing protein [Streptomyces iconiensis]
MSPKRAYSGEAAPATPGAVWLRAGDRRPASRAPALTRERIVTATVALLDGQGAQGVQGLSMRKLAESLDVHATSLYWHVSHRDDLLDLALDAVFAEVTLPEPNPDTRDADNSRTAGAWREDVGLFMDELRTALLRHPWSAPLASSRPLLGPQALARSEFVYAALVAGGFEGDDLTAAAAAVSNYVIGTVSAETAWQYENPGEEAAGRRALVAHLRAAGEEHPTLAAHPPSLSTDWEGHFARGRDFLLDGLAHAVAPSG